MIEVDDVSTLAGNPDLSVRLKIGGRSYVATCPKEAVWASVVASRSADAAPADQTRAMFLFLTAALGTDAASDLQRRINNGTDPVNLEHLIRAYNAMIGEWAPTVGKRFEALGLRFEAELEATIVLGPPASVPAASNRAERRATTSKGKPAKRVPAKGATATARRGGIQAAGRADV